MWGENNNICENNCQCSGLITDNFKINSGNNATKRRQEEAFSSNFKLKMKPNTLDFNRTQSPIKFKSPVNHLQSPTPPKRRVFGELQNTAFNTSPMSERSFIGRALTPLKKSPLASTENSSPLTSRSERFSIKKPHKNNATSTKISKIFQERSKFKMSSKENFVDRMFSNGNTSSFMSDTYLKLDMEEETRDFTSFPNSYSSNSLTANRNVGNDWSSAKLDFTGALQSSKPFEMELPKETNRDLYVPENDIHNNMDEDYEALHDLEAEFDCDNFDSCTKYEIISTDSPDIISRGRQSSSRKVTSKNFIFGASLTDSEASTSFNKPNVSATRMLNFEDEAFEFTSPAIKKPGSVNVKKSLKFSETPTKNVLRHEKSDSSIGSMSSSPAMSLRIFPSESTTSMESGFISELEEPFLEIEENSNSPKVADFNKLLSGPIKNSPLSSNFFNRPHFNRSLSYNPDSSKAKVSLLSILESPSNEKRSHKRSEPSEEVIGEQVSTKRRKSNVNLEIPKPQRPILQRAFSESNASIMSALARSAIEPDLIGDFSLPYALPLTKGAKDDLKYISSDTLVDLMKGRYQDSVIDYQVIDCRYPYEFSGGHINGAKNMYTPQQVLRLLENEEKCMNSDDSQQRKKVLVFHCEFSIERGPKLFRFLRSSDRAKNRENYPSLNYPEIYLLHEGYRNFYKKHTDLCTPEGYTAMLDPKHKDSLRQHRSLPTTTTQQRRNRLLL